MGLRFKILVFTGLSICLALFFPLCGQLFEAHADQVSTLVEETALLALFAGAMTLVRFYARRNNTFLVIGTGFLGAALLDGYHAISTSTSLSWIFPSDPGALGAWGWMAGRFFLAGMLCLSWLAWRREERLGEAGRLHPQTIYLGTGALVLAFFLFFFSVPLPEAYRVAGFLRRPAEVLPALLFLAALAGYLHKGHWREDAFEFFLVLALLVCLAAQVPFMALSESLGDSRWMAAYLLKGISYILVLVGLLVNAYHLFRRAEESAEEVGRAYELLEEEVRQRRQVRRELDQVIASARCLVWEARVVDRGAVLDWDWQILNEEQVQQFLPLEVGAEQSYGEVFNESIPLEDMERMYEQSTRLLRQGEPHYSLEFPLRTLSGELCWLYTDVQVEKKGDGEWNLTGVCTDISALKQVTQERDRFFSLALDLLCIVGFDGYFKRLNPSWEQVLGYSQKELMATPFIDFVHPEDRQTTLGEAEKLAQGGIPLTFENRYRCKDGSYRWLLWTAIADVGSELIYATARDISERKQVEVELGRARDAAETANRAKSQFLASMSHELRTPMNAILGFSEVLLDRTFGPLNERQSRYVENVLQAGRHLLQLINDILDLSKVEAGRMELDIENMEANAALSDVERIVRGLARKKGIELIVHRDGELPLEADPAKFKQVLYNLLSNAIKFTPEGGCVEAGAHLQQERVRVWVRDTGIGIEKKDQGRLFHSFEQIDSSYARYQEGTGLGLALSRRLVELHGGRIWAESEGRGRGSTFAFELPVLQSREEDEEMPDLAPGAGPLVLVVEDDRQARLLLGHFLKQAGYSVAYARSGERALEMARQLRPHAITLDVILPGMDGWEVLRELRVAEETREIPVIVVTITEDSKLAAALGAMEFLVKPVERGVLLGAVRRACEAESVRTVLVVDDEPGVLELVGDILRSEGYQVFTAGGGRQGVEMALERKPDLLVLDLMMPGMSGFEVVEALRALPEGRDLPVVVYTAKDLTAQEREQLALQVQGVVPKEEEGREQLLAELRRLERAQGVMERS